MGRGRLQGLEARVDRFLEDQVCVCVCARARERVRACVFYAYVLTLPGMLCTLSMSVNELGGLAGVSQACRRRVAGVSHACRRRVAGVSQACRRNKA